MGTKAHGRLVDLSQHATNFSELGRKGSDLIRYFLVVFDHRGTHILLLITALSFFLVTFSLALALAFPTNIRLLITRSNGIVLGDIGGTQEGPVVSTSQQTLP